MTAAPAPPPADPTGTRPQSERVRHFGGFLLAGILALLTDMAVLRGLTDIVGLAVLVARPISIATAMVVSWWVNRTVTFSVSAPVRFDEFAKFALASFAAQVVNYITFSAILIARPATGQEVAIIAASIVSMVVAYVGFRFGVFQHADNGQSGQGK